MNNKLNKIEYIELSQKSELIENKLKISPTHYETLENNKVYKYPLEEGKWNEILQKIHDIDYKKIDEIIVPSEEKSDGRLFVKDLKSVITIKDDKGTYVSKSFSQTDNLNALEDLYKTLESYLPLR